MSIFLNALKQSELENRRKSVVIFCLLGLLGAVGWSYKTVVSEFTVHIPPDLRSGATIKANATPEVPPWTTYTFAYYVWQQVNRWPTDGSKNYGEQIFNMQYYLTPSCRAQLQADMNVRFTNGELSSRTRSAMEIPGLGFTDERVIVTSGNSWKVLLDLHLQETQNGTPIKDTFIRYPIRIVRFDIDRSKNQWGLAVDCFGTERPARLEPKAVEVAQSNRAPVALPVERVAPTSPLRVGDGTAPTPTAAPGGVNASQPGGPASAGAPPIAPITPTTLPRLQ